MGCGQDQPRRKPLKDVPRSPYRSIGSAPVRHPAPASDSAAPRVAPPAYRPEGAVDQAPHPAPASAPAAPRAAPPAYRPAGAADQAPHLVPAGDSVAPRVAPPAYRLEGAV